MAGRKCVYPPATVTDAVILFKDHDYKELYNRVKDTVITTSDNGEKRKFTFI